LGWSFSGKVIISSWQKWSADSNSTENKCSPAQWQSSPRSAKPFTLELVAILSEIKKVKSIGKAAALLSLSVSFLTAESVAKPKKIPHAKIIVHPGPPVKPTQPAKPVGKQKSDWGEGDKANK
jgi:hypothetical protein